MAAVRPPVLLLLLQLLCLCCLHVWTVPENVALGKQTSSSSAYSNWTSSHAVDGNMGQAPEDAGKTYLCAHTAIGDPASWWWVDLGSVFPMDKIVIYYRKKTLYRFTGATVNIANSSDTETTCATISNITQYESDAIVRLSCPQSGQRLILRQNGACGRCIENQCADCFLELCEVQIFACTNGTYGPDCTGQCGHCSDSANCHHVTGSCLSGSCQHGYRGDKCDQVCMKGTHGQNCAEQCGHCSDSASCHHVTGSCLNGSCQPGYWGVRCDQVCMKGTHGQNCAEQCGHCSDGANCHHVTGSCLSGSCQPGYRGDRCDQECSKTSYGQNCSGTCGHCSNVDGCHPVNGSCLSGGCQPGYRGDRCEQGVDATEATVQCPAGCRCPPSRSAGMEGLGVGVAIGFAVCLALNAVSLAVFCCVRRYRRGPETKGSSTLQRDGDTTRGREASAYYNVSSTPAAVEGGSPYESLDTATRTENVPNDYVSIGSPDK